MGPTAILLHRFFDNNETAEQTGIAATAIYAEAAVGALSHFIDTIRFWRLWRTRYIPRVYSRRLKGFGLLDFLVPIRESDTGIQYIRHCHFLCVAFLACLGAASLCTPVIILFARGIQSRAEGTVNTIALFLLITIGTSGNFVAGLMFLIERLENEGLYDIQGAHLLIAISFMYGCWIIFELVNTVCRTWVYTSSDPALRALANVYSFHVTTDAVVSTKEQRSGRIDGGKIYANLRAAYGSGMVTIDTAPVTQELSLGEVSKLS